MASPGIVEYVYLDAQAYEGESFNFSSKHFTILTKHLTSGRLKLVITDITRSEVHARIDKNLETEFTAVKNLQKNSRVLRSSPVAAPIFTTLDRAVVAASVHKAFDDFLGTHKATVIEATKQDASPIFERYFAVKPPFGAGDKRKEFPDAFTAAALCDWSADQGVELFVVSADELFGEACDECDDLYAEKSLSALLDHVASDDEKLAAFLRTQIKKHLEEIQNKAKTAFEELEFHLKDEWGDVEVTVTDIELYGEPELVEIDGNEVTVEVRFTAQYDADLSYEDSSTGVYDSEDKRMMFMDHVNETVQDSELLSMTVKATFDGTDEDQFEIDDIELTDPSSGFGVSTSRMAGYPWK